MRYSSFESGASYGFPMASNSPHNSRPPSPSGSPPSGRVSPPASATPPPATSTHLALPEQAHHSIASTSRVPTARSPLARLSLVRTSITDVDEEEEDVAAEGSAGGRHSESPPFGPLPSLPGSAEDREGRPKERRKLQKKKSR